MVRASSQQAHTMSVEAQAITPTVLWAGRLISGLAIAFLLLDAGMKLVPLEPVIDAMRTIAGRLGFNAVFRYQKYRTEYKQPSRSGVATLDETPIGVYLELEGQPAWIDRTAKKLGYTEQDYITSSYGRLYLEWRERHKSAPHDMLFR